jgi:DNA (cytosine-5)-methyltransferase 3A
MKNIGNVVSLFDGSSGGQIALERSGIGYDNYFASEIDKHAIKVTQANYPNTIQLGDVTKISGNNLPKIDLLFGGSPCQTLSRVGNGQGFDGKSGLFWEYVRVLKETQPKYFLFENVVMKKKEWEKIITDALGVEPVFINSSLVSAQNRERLYWANFEIKQPEDKKINLIDILEGDGIVNSNLNKATIIGRRLNERGVRDDYNKNIPITQCLEVRATNINKCNCLTTVEKDNVLTTMPIGRHRDAFKNKLPFRYYTLKEYCRVQTIPENYFDNIVSESQAKKMIGNGWTIDVIAHILKNMPI